MHVDPCWPPLPAAAAVRTPLGTCQADLVVEAPEFMTVSYLKRRVVKAKLQRGEVGAACWLVWLWGCQPGCRAPCPGAGASLRWHPHLMLPRAYGVQAERSKHNRPLPGCRC